MKNRTHPSASAQDFMTFFMIFAEINNIIFRDAHMLSIFHLLLKRMIEDEPKCIQSIA